MATMWLEGEKIAFLCTNGFEDTELSEPWKTVVDAGGKAVLVSPHSGVITGKWGHRATVDLPVDLARASLFDALVLPGGRTNSDILRQNPDAIGFVKDFFAANKPVAAICRGSWILAEAKVVKGRRLTSTPGLKEVHEAAGAHWVDEEVVIDDRLITSRKPADLPAFIAALVAAIAED